MSGFLKSVQLAKARTRLHELHKEHDGDVEVYGPLWRSHIRTLDLTLEECETYFAVLWASGDNRAYYDSMAVYMMTGRY